MKKQILSALTGPAADVRHPKRMKRKQHIVLALAGLGFAVMLGFAPWRAYGDGTLAEFPTRDAASLFTSHAYRPFWAAPKSHIPGIFYAFDWLQFGLHFAVLALVTFLFMRSTKEEWRLPE